MEEPINGLMELYAPVNLGFARGNNFAAAHANGRYFIFLNDDSVVHDGWLSALIEAAESDARIGAVGSRIIDPNGALQEAGAIIWADGSCYPVGRGEPPGSVAYAFARDVEYASANAMLVRRSTFEAAGGFDERYYPAYYEDVDLCMTIRHTLGQRVVYEPRSVVAHHEAATAGRDPEFRMFLFRRHQKIFFEKWARYLKDYTYPGVLSPVVVERAIMSALGNPKRVLVVDDRVPGVGIGSGAGRIAEMLEQLRSYGFATAFAPTDVKERLTGNPLAALGIDLVAEPLFDHIVREEKRYDVIIISRPHNFRAYYEAIRAAQPDARIVYDIEALYHRRLFLQANSETNESRRSRLYADAEDMEKLEVEIVRSADHLVAISNSEAHWVEGVDKHAPVEYMRPMSRAVQLTSPSIEGRCGAIFAAGWLAGADSPNVGALRWYATEVLPRVRERLPNFRTFVTGENPPLAVQLLEGDGIELVGLVPCLGALYSAVRVAIAPILIGAGVKIKTIEALQYGVPVVATTVGAEGLDVTDAADIDISDDPGGFATKLIALCSDDQLWRQRRQHFLTRLADWEKSHVQWPEIVAKVMNDSTARRIGRC